MMSLHQFSHHLCSLRLAIKPVFFNLFVFFLYRLFQLSISGSPLLLPPDKKSSNSIRTDIEILIKKIIQILTEQRKLACFVRARVISLDYCDYFRKSWFFQKSLQIVPALINRRVNKTNEKSFDHPWMKCPPALSRDQNKEVLHHD